MLLPRSPCLSSVCQWTRKQAHEQQAYDTRPPPRPRRTAQGRGPAQAVRERGVLLPLGSRQSAGLAFERSVPTQVAYGLCAFACDAVHVCITLLLTVVVNQTGASKLHPTCACAVRRRLMQSGELFEEHFS